MKKKEIGPGSVPSTPSIRQWEPQSFQSMFLSVFSKRPIEDRMRNELTHDGSKSNAMDFGRYLHEILLHKRGKMSKILVEAYAAG